LNPNNSPRCQQTISAGINDILFGLPLTTLNTSIAAGAVMVIYGQQQFASRVIDTAQLSDPSEVSRFQRATDAQYELNGVSVSFVGDVNGDGAVDFIFGGPYADGFSGRVYLIYGIPNPTPTTSPSLSASHSPSPSMSISVSQRATRTQTKPTRRPRKSSPPRMSPIPTPQKTQKSSAGMMATWWSGHLLLLVLLGCMRGELRQ